MTKNRHRVWSLFLVLAAAILLAACGSSSDNDNSSSGSAGGSSSSGSSGGSGSSGKVDGRTGVTVLQVFPDAENKVELAKQIVAEPTPKESVAQLVEKKKKSEPDKWEGPSDPVKPPAKKQKLGLISCAAVLHGCVTPLLGAQEAAKELGWTTKIYDGGGTPATANKVMLAALSSGATAIIFTSINPTLIQQGMLAAKKAGVPVISASSGSDSPNPKIEAPAGKVWPLVDIAQSFVETGRQMADWIINDSGGKAHALVLTDKEYTSGVSQSGAVDEFNKLCPDCKLTTFDFTGTSVGTSLPQRVVGYLRSHQDVNYVVTPYDPSAAAIVPAMAQAGLTSVKVCGLLGDQQNLDFIRNGQIQACDAGYDQRYDGWAAVDQLMRHLAKQPFADPHGENVPSVLLDKTNLPPAGDDWRTPIDYKTEYKKLWGLG